MLPFTESNPILAIETAANQCSVCIAQQSIGFTYHHDSPPIAPAERLILLIEACLKESTITYEQLGAIAVTIGPGSFTGVRVGLAAAQGIALVGRLPLIGISTLQTLAFAIPSDRLSAHTMITALIRANAHSVYCQMFNHHYAPISEAALLSYEEAAARIPAHSIIIGDGVSGVLPFLTTEGFQILDASLAELNAKTLAKAASILLKVTPLGNHPTPLYLRPANVKFSPTTKSSR